jgi:O-antigen/teichoic acid export membrane protein
LGIIQKQSISGTIYSYIGVLLGFIITGLLFPRVFITDEVGLLRVLVSYSTLLAQFAGLGFSAVTVKLFPFFQNDKKNHHGFLGLIALVSLAGFLIAATSYLLFKPVITQDANQDSALFVSYFYYVIPLIFFTLFFNVFDAYYYRVLYNAVKGIVVKEVIQRIFILAVILLFYFEIISFHQTVILYLLAIIFPALAMFFSLVRAGKFNLKLDLKFIDKKFGKEIASVAFYGIIASFSGVLVMNIDVLIVNHSLGLSAAGIFAITSFFGSLILVPLRTMGKISSVVISEAWKNNDLELINKIYYKSSLSLSVIGLLLFIGIWGNIDNVFHLITDKYLPGRMVIFFIGISNLFDIALGVSPHIIVNSRYYKYLAYFILGFAVLIVLFNLLLIPIYGITGAALAALFAKLIYNFVKYGFLYKKYGFQPFDLNYVWLILIGLFAYYASTFVPAFSNYIIDIILRSALISILFSAPVYLFKISDDINARVDYTLKKIFRKP